MNSENKGDKKKKGSDPRSLPFLKESSKLDYFFFLAAFFLAAFFAGFFAIAFNVLMVNKLFKRTQKYNKNLICKNFDQIIFISQTFYTINISLNANITALYIFNQSCSLRVSTSTQISFLHQIKFAPIN